ncbi:MAG: acetyl-CoA carboxylase biotin carboxyl carrier protein subunit, partial [Solirubrobacteraceae bacterium]
MSLPSELAVTAPFPGVVVAVEHGPGGSVPAGAAVVVLEAMKMEHEILAEAGGVVSSVEVAVGDSVQEGELLLVLTPGDTAARETAGGAAPSTRDPRAVRADVAA